MMAIIIFAVASNPMTFRASAIITVCIIHIHPTNIYTCSKSRNIKSDLVLESDADENS
jgi:hypothetical protein